HTDDDQEQVDEQDADEGRGAGLRHELGGVMGDALAGDDEVQGRGNSEEIHDDGGHRHRLDERRLDVLPGELAVDETDEDGVDGGKGAELGGGGDAENQAAEDDDRGEKGRST